MGRVKCLVCSIKVVKEKKPLLVAGSFLAFQPAPLSRIVLAFRSVDSGRYIHSCSAFGFLYQRFSSLLGDEASPFRDQQSSSTVVRCQPWFYWGLVAHSFFGLSEAD
jgi:hypothetical protein